MQTAYKETLSKILGEIPLTAEFYFQLKNKGEPGTRFSLKNIQSRMPQILRDIELYKIPQENPKKIFVFTSLHYWIEQAATVSLYFAAKGHNDADWQKPINKFDLRRQDPVSYTHLRAHETG